MAERTPRILLPLDGSVPAAGPLEIAGALADVMEAEIDVLFVGPEPLDEQALADRTRVPGEWRPRVHLHGACGEPVAEILRDAAERPPPHDHAHAPRAISSCRPDTSRSAC
jgi:nucleotide-binding universal stress UspA family protein